MRFVRRSLRILPVLFLAAAVSCATDEPEEPAATAQAEDPNVLSITAREYEFAVEGEPQAGALTIDVENAGEEWHEIVMAKLKDGKTLEDVRTALKEAGEEEDPFEEFAEESREIDDLGGSQFPGTRYAITGTDASVEPGEYILTCFVPDAEGKPHWSLGMLSEFTIGEERATEEAEEAEEREADVTFTINDDGLEGPETIDAGETTMRIVNDSDGTRELGLLRIKDGSTPDDVAESLAGADEGPPDPDTAPFDFFAYIFDAEQDRSITVDLTPGQWALQSGDPENQEQLPPDEDPNTVMFTVE